MEKWIKILKEMFCEFDKNDIHKDYTFIFAHRSIYGFHNSFYKLNGKEYVALTEKNDEKHELRSMFLTRVEFDKKYESPESLFMRFDPETNEYDRCYESELEREVDKSHYELAYKKYLLENINRKDPRYKLSDFCKILQYGLFEEEGLIHQL